MATFEIALWIGWFILWIVLRNINVYLGSALVFITFIFAFITSNQQFSVFYILLYLVAIVLDFAIGEIHTTSDRAMSIHVGKINVSRFGLITAQVITGLVIYLMISIISARVGGNIIGVPNLAVSSASELGKSFKPVYESALGIVENAFVFVLFDLIMVFGVLIPIIGLFVRATVFLIPLLLSSFIIAVFHVSAYSVSVSLMIYAMAAFAIFIISKLLFKDSLTADTAHYLNNGLISISRNLQVV